MAPAPDPYRVGGGAKEEEDFVIAPSKKKDDKIEEELVQLPPLNLPLTSNQEFLEKIESILKQDHPCPLQQQLPESPKNLEKPKAMNFPISKITIGEWTSTALFPDDLKAKFYFAKRKIMWEILEDVETATHVARLKRKIEIHWDDVLSFRATVQSGILQLELRKRPAFFMEANPQPGKHTQWIQMDQDFTLNQSASIFRRHTLHFSSGVLEKNLGKIVSSDSFWSKLDKVTFPTLPHSLYFDVPDGNSNKKRRYGQYQTPNNDDLFHHLPPGQVGEVNSNLATQFYANYGRQMNSLVLDNRQNKTMSQLPGTQVIQPSSQLMNRGRYIRRSQLNNPMIQDERHRIFEHANEISFYQVGPNLRGDLGQEGETQNLEHTHLDGNFQTNNICYDDQDFNNNRGSVPPDS
ncbi:uncharacterized protein LOC18025680 isoform X2 [Eutrema salsugineum]|uniref:uncharacterized protein LOC18025680 isoform X2 n=1 Tax=Eutrema salsugineum TaxID=72664 RepID=UPI000CED1831|nr:uncharacterized protein LOC18025680 isoform X2 [Eutrema salsugineum]